MIQTLPLAWGARVSPAFRERVYQLCDRLVWSEDHASWLMAAMAPSLSGSCGVPSFLRSPR